MTDYFRGQQYDSWSDEAKAMKHFLLQQRANQGEIPDRYYLGNFERKILASEFEKKCPSPEDKKIYANTVATYQAFTAIALENLDMPNVSQESRTITLQRGVRTEHAGSSKQGIADSTSIDTPSYRFTGAGTSTLAYTVPFDDVLALYSISPTLSCDYDHSEKNNLGVEHEVICDMSNAQITKLKDN